MDELNADTSIKMSPRSSKPPLPSKQSEQVMESLLKAGSDPIT